MNPEQYTHLLATLGDIKTSQGRIEERIQAHMDADSKIHIDFDKDIKALHHKSNKNTTAIARLRGIGAGIGGVFTLLLGYFGIDTFGGS